VILLRTLKAVCLALSLVLLASAEHAALASETKDSRDIQEDLAVAIVRKMLAAIDNANQAENYGVLWGLGSKDFREQVTPEDLSNQFSVLREKKISLLSSLLATPVFTAPLKLSANNRLGLAGYVPTRPLETAFVFRFMWEDEMWRVEEMAIDLTPPRPSAPKAKPRVPRPTQTPEKWRNIPKPSVDW
jgi:hypothetical protein